MALTELAAGGARCRQGEPIPMQNLIVVPTASCAERHEHSELRMRYYERDLLFVSGVEGRLDDRAVLNVLLIAFSRNHELPHDGEVAGFQILHAPVRPLLCCSRKLQEEHFQR